MPCNTAASHNRVFNKRSGKCSSIFPEARYNDTVSWPFAKLADLWGGRGIRALTPRQLRDALHAANDEDRFTLIEDRVEERGRVAHSAWLRRGVQESRLSAGGRASMTSVGFDGDIVWRPTRDMIKASQLRRFMSAHGIRHLSELHRRSVDDPQWFWNAVLADLGIEFFTPYDEVIDMSKGLPWTRWCVGGEMNIVHNCLDKRMGTSASTLPLCGGVVKTATQRSSLTGSCGVRSIARRMR